MRHNTLEIRWHDTKPIFTCDFQPFEATTLKRQLHPYQRQTEGNSNDDGTLWRVATAGGDNTVRIWLVIPNPPPETISTQTTHGSATRPAPQASSSSQANAKFGVPKVEYLATLKLHNLAVNCVRFSPAGNLLASSGDDAGTGGIVIHTLSQAAPTSQYGSTEESAYDREVWTTIRMIRCSSREVYDLAWSPDGKYILAGGTDGCARIYRVADGTLAAEAKDHKDWIQGVTWDPNDKFVATQSKDRTMNVYSLERPSENEVKLELISRNLRLTTTKPISTPGATDPTTATGNATSGTGQPPNSVTSTQLLYGDEETTPFFRRLTFSPDGALLVTPAAIHEDNESAVSALFPTASSSHGRKASQSSDPSHSRRSSPVEEIKKAPNGVNGKEKESTLKKVKTTRPTPTVYMFARGQLANETPIAHLPGHKTASIATKWNPVLWQPRKSSIQDKGKERAVDGGANDADEMAIDEQTASKEVRAETENMPTSPFSLPYRMLYAVATHESVMVYDTAQTTPICWFSQLHFAAFTDLSWTADGMTLMATSGDGYATIFAFDEGELGIPCEKQPVRQVAATPSQDMTPSLRPAPAPVQIDMTQSSPLAGHTSQGISAIHADANLSNGGPASRSGDAEATSSPVGKVKKRVPLQYIGPLA